MPGIFDKGIRKGLPGRSLFDLSHEVKGTCEMGQLIPVMLKEMMPGDRFKVGEEVVIRFPSMIKPVMHDIDVSFHAYAVAYRILDPTFEDFITGGPDGDDATVIPRWNPTNYGEGSLWDYFCFPLGVKPFVLPLDYPRRAYNMIWNEYYRDENYQDEIALTNENILYRSWDKDYFTTALPWTQRGTPPALPIDGIAHAYWEVDNFQLGNFANQGSPTFDRDSTVSHAAGSGSDAEQRLNFMNFMNDNDIDLGVASTFDINDLRAAIQLQVWMEANARGGSRYIDQLNVHFGTSPKDERMQRPEYIGGHKAPVIVSEVRQTSASNATDDTPQGNIAGIGFVGSNGFIGEYFAQEHCLIMVLMSVMPRPAYQEGLDREWARVSRYDFPWPEFVNLGEQEVLKQELQATGVEAEDTDIFGYQMRYAELRIAHSKVCGKMRSEAAANFSYWHLARDFGGISQELGPEFLTCIPDKRIFSVETEPSVFYNILNKIEAIRPIPYIAVPGRFF